MGNRSKSKKTEQRKSRGHLWQYAVSATILLIGILGSILVYLSLHGKEQENIARDFKRSTQERTAAIRKTLDFDLFTLQAIRSFYNSSTEVTQKELKVFVEPFINDHPSIHSIAWIPRVSDSERTKFEERAAQKGIHNFQINELNAQGKKVRATHRNEYFPAYFIVPSKSLTKSEHHYRDTTFLGYDLSTIPECREAMKRACNTGKHTLTSNISALPNRTHADLIAFLPLYEKNAPLDTVKERQSSLAGYVVATLDSEWILKESLGQIKSPDINVELFDTTNSNRPELFYAYPWRMQQTIDGRPKTFSKASPLSTIIQLDIAGREWSIAYTATPWFVAQRESWYPWIIAAGAMIICTLLSSFLLGIAKKNVRTAKLADQLSTANQQLKKEINGREFVEATLRTSEVKYKTLYETSADAILLSTPEGQFIDGNDAAIKLFGCKHKDELVALSAVNVLPKHQPDGLDSFKKATQVLKAATKKGFQCFEWLIKRNDGTELLTSITLTRMELEGKPILLATIRDITEQRRAEKALQASERRLRLFAENVEDVLWTMTTDGLFTYISPSIEKMLKFKWEEGAKVTIADIMTPDSLVIAQETLRNLHTQAQTDQRVETQEIVLELVRTDGSSLWTGVTVSALYDESGEVIGALGITRDITERKQAEEERTLDAQRMESLLALNRMSDHPIDEISATTIEEATRLTKSKIGYLATMNEDETILTMQYWSKSATESYNIPDRPISYPLEETGLWGEAVRQRKPIITNDYTAPNPHKRGIPEGHIPLVRHMNIPVFEGNKIIGVAGVGNKESDYNERDLTQLQLLLGGWRQILSKKKYEAALAQARDIAEKANKSKSQFLANMSHEIRTPMTAILGYADLLMNPKISTSTQHNYAATIRRNGEHLLTLINDILDISKIEAGKMTLDVGPCNIALLLEDVASMVRPRALVNRVDFSIEYLGPTPETIQTDEARLRQAIINLAGNAVKFTENGSVRIVVSCVEHEETCYGEPTIHLQVIDTGIGIREDILSKLFQPFSQASSSINHKYGGTGLGLAISRHIAQMLGGELTATSECGKGSTFTLTIPTGSLQRVRMVNHSKRTTPETEDHHEWQPTSQNLEGVKILLAEDGYDNRCLVKTMLAETGARIDTVENGQEAVKQVNHKKYDAILMDINMPVMDGYQATGQLRSQGHAMPIIALTANAMPEDRDRCLSAGCDEYISKPIDRVLLIHTIEKLVGVSHKTT